MKCCNGCKKDLPLEAFWRLSSSPDGLNARCKSCVNAATYKWREEHPERYREANRQSARRATYRKKYNTDEATVEALLNEQGHVCAICGEPERTKGVLSVDHNHETGVVRGMLCNDCNRGIGLLKDSPGVLRAALNYLEERGYGGSVSEGAHRI